MPLLGPVLRRARVADRSRLRALVALACSLLLNAAAAWLVARAGAFGLATRPPARTPVALAPLGAAEWDANRAVRAPEPEARREQERGTVVELSPEQRAAERPPDDAKFLSDRDTRVERETVSRYAGRYPRLAPKPEPGAPVPGSEVPAAPAPAPRRQARAGDAAQRGPRRGEERADAGSELALRGGGEAAARPAPGAESAPEGRRPDLRLSPDALARIAGGPSMDGYGQVEEGEETWLQSREFRYATFLNQMRREIGDEWYPRVREAIGARDPEGDAFFYRERTVVLAVTLDTAGELKDLSVLQSSAIDFVDRIALASVREAQPFPNPPRGLFQGEERARIPFAFTIYPSERRPALRWNAPDQP